MSVDNPKRPRYEANERFDTVDAEESSQTARLHLDAIDAAVIAEPQAVAGSTPVGLILTGFGLTLNPTGPTDGKVRVQSALGAAFDSAGRLIIKPSGETADLVIPAGVYHVYAYYIETAGDNAVRRFLTVTAPYTEYSRAINTTLKGDVGFLVRTGDDPPTSIVASDNVNGQTVALCFLGAVNNTAGTVTATGYNATTAPNGAYAVNRMSSVLAPATPPEVNTQSGSVATLWDMLTTLAYQVGQLIWKNSLNLTPAAGNNFGAYNPPPVGIDGLFNQTSLAQLTAITAWRDFLGHIRFVVDHNGYPSGEISTLQEDWRDGGLVTRSVPIEYGFASAGSLGTDYSRSPGLLILHTTSAVWKLSVGDIPANASLQDVILNHQDDVNGDSYLITVSSATPSSAIAAVDKTITTTIPYTQDDVFVSPSAGSPPMIVTTGEFLVIDVRISASAGPTNYRVYDFLLTYLVDPAGWTWTGSTGDNSGTSGDQRLYLDPISGFNQRHLQLISGGTVSATGASKLVSKNEVFFTPDTALSLDYEVKTGTVIDGPNDAQIQLGVVTPPFASTFVGLFGVPGSLANWQLHIGASNTDTGVAIANNTVYKVKLDILGANADTTVTAGHTRVRLYINGALVANVITNEFTSTLFATKLQVAATALSSGPYDVRVGRLRRSWNHYLSGDNL